ncbi:flagellar biosynthetic protein FliO [Clostridium carnis]
MELSFLFMIIKLVFALGIVLALMYLAFKLSGEKIDKLNKNKYIKILERIQMSKDSSIVLLKIGEKGYVMSISNGKTEKLEEISKEEILKLENSKNMEKKELTLQYQKLFDKVKDKILKLKSKSKLKEEKDGK